jgi:ankyrin repeat protein
MDRLVKPDVQELSITFNKSEKCSSTFRLTNLMHTMSVAVALTTTSPSTFSFTRPFSILPPLSSSTYTVIVSKPSDRPPISSPTDNVVVRSSMLPTGKAQHEDLSRLFSKPGPHIFKDATIPISFIGPNVVEFLLCSSSSKALKISDLLPKAISGCDKSQLDKLLRSAASIGNMYFGSALIDSGADVNNRDSDGSSVLSLAVKSGNIDLVSILIESGSVFDNQVDRFLHDCAEMNRVDLMEILCLCYLDLDVNSLDSNNQSTPLHVAAIHGHVEAIRFLVSVGANPELADSNGNTPLHYSASEGHSESVELLLNCSSYCKYAINKQGKTAFAIAKEKNHTHLYDVLQLGDVLHRSARLGDVNAMKSCISEGGKVNGRDQNGWTPLHRAAFKGKLDCVKLLLNNGASVDLIDDNGQTALHRAVEGGHVEVALYLVAHGARTNMKSLVGLVPLNLDTLKNHPALVTPLS